VGGLGRGQRGSRRPRRGNWGWIWTVGSRGWNSSYHDTGSADLEIAGGPVLEAEGAVPGAGGCTIRAERHTEALSGMVIAAIAVVSAVRWGALVMDTIGLGGVGEPKDHATGVLALTGIRIALGTGGCDGYPELITGAVAALWDVRHKGDAGGYGATKGTWL